MELPLRAGLIYALGKLINTYHVYTACMSPALNGSSALERFEHSNAIKIRNGIMFDFYPGLPHIEVMLQNKAEKIAKIVIKHHTGIKSL